MPPPDIGTMLRHASQMFHTGRVAEAIIAYERLLTIQPNLPDSWFNLAMSQRRSRLFTSALESYQRALDFGARTPEEVHLRRAAILSDDLGDSAGAQTELEQALQKNPTYQAAYLNLGNVHEDRGDHATARLCYEHALALDPQHSLALARLAGTSSITDSADPLVDRLESAIRAPSACDADRADLGFALGRVLDAAGAYDAAFAAYEAANAASRRCATEIGIRYDRATFEQFIDRLIKIFSAPIPFTHTRPAEDTPLFICGMFRSGSTLVEQMLAQHRGIAAGGEIDALPALIQMQLMPYPDTLESISSSALSQLRKHYLLAVGPRRRVGARLSDKRPDNFLHIGLIKMLFPDARIVHTCRNALDNCLSVYFLHLDHGMSYATDLEDIAHFDLQHRRLMDHWRAIYPDQIIDVDYDELVVDPRPALEPVLDALGLTWEPDILHFHEADNAVRTASNLQVRRQLYQTASGRAAGYMAHLQRVIAMFDSRSIR